MPRSSPTPAAASDPLETLVLDLLVWLEARPRPYAEVMDAWRTSCPRLPVWEEASARGLLHRTRDPVRGPLVQLSQRGRAVLRGPRRA